MSLILSGTDGLSDVDGTAATPAIRGTDANTGIFFPAADTVATSVGGTEGTRLTSTGLGIGTSSPTFKLDVDSTSGARIKVAAGGYNWLSLVSGDTGNLSFAINDNGGSGAFRLMQYNSGGTFVRAVVDVTSAGNVKLSNSMSVGGATVSTSGTGITFPATQSASSDANTLDDYEEGTWTPVAAAVTVNSGTPVYSGAYTKIGRIVHITMAQSGGDITLTGGGISNFSGLPFTVASNATSNALWSDGSAKTGTVYAYEGGTLIYVLQAITNFSNLTALRITATYQV